MQERATLTESTVNWSEADRRLMTLALDLAAQGISQVSPGPLVGCVIVDSSAQVIGEGFYIFDRIKHAETIALEQALERARGGTAYVSLEPHAHHGRTPPCTDALLQAGIARVVAPIADPNPLVSGKGFAHLRAEGVAVQTGLMAREAQRVNEKYFHFMRTGRPFVHLKMAVSLDGKIATRTGDSRWIAGPEARARAHEYRHECDAILVGAGTVAIDDPLLTDRSCKPRRKPLIRVVLDERVEMSPASQLARTAAESPVMLFTGHAGSGGPAAHALKAQGVELISDESGGRDLVKVLEELGKRSIQSVLIEGGGRVAGALLDAQLVNKVTFFIAPLIIGGQEAPAAVGGVGAEKMADALRLQDITVVARGADIEVTGYCSGTRL